MGTATEYIGNNASGKVVGPALETSLLVFIILNRSPRFLGSEIMALFGITCALLALLQSADLGNVLRFAKYRLGCLFLFGIVFIIILALSIQFSRNLCF